MSWCNLVLCIVLLLVVVVVVVVVGNNYHDYLALQARRKQFDICPAYPTAKGSGECCKHDTTIADRILESYRIMHSQRLWRIWPPPYFRFGNSHPALPHESMTLMHETNIYVKKV